MFQSISGAQIIAGLTASLVMLSTGYHYGWSSPSLPKLQSGEEDFTLTSGQGAWIVSMLTVGGLCGSPTATVLIDKIGRKLTLLLTSVPLICSGVLLCVAQGYWWLIAARFIAGIGTGMSYVASPMYVAEISSDNIRGALSSTLNYMSAFGTLVAYVVGPWVSRAVLASIGLIFPVAFALIFIWMPESPYFWIMKNKEEEAIKSLRRLKGVDEVTADVEKVKTSTTFDKQNAASYKDLVLVPGNRKALIIVLGLVIAQQFSGSMAILSYSGLIIDAAGSSLDSNISLIIIGLVQVGSSVLCIFVVDLAGRKVLLLGSALGVAVSLGAVAVYFQLQAAGIDVSSISLLPLLGLGVFLFAYAIGLGPLQQVVLGEVFPYNVKALAVMVTTLTGSLGAVTVAKLYQIVADLWGIQASLWGFAGITVLSALFILFFVPETKQKSLLNIQEQLHKTTESTTELEKSAK
ncbi:facilitated trehalose transporter Tret1-2 homolog [Athalia rosae]|uniref:facilitated trehalose transporter Tret1-2 homolog n=1 Tax=Athalia rosae TaxID=37344 RepID=UPI0020335820|nr:facilitated trehalose transporter Tret1-2 homolog [Athalia rosae]XP_048508262.1 facilitated trehalose transporter Tret1-2 homolog [Athalia rosae]